MANALTGRPIDLSTFYDQPLDDPEVLATAAKATCPPDSEVDFPAHFSGEVRVHLADGRVLRRKVADSHGTAQDPMTDDEVRGKFNATAERRLPPEQAARFAELTLRLETLDGVNQLIDASIVPGAHPGSG